MDILLLFVGFFIMLLGIIGSFLPILPGPITGWVGLLILHYTSVIEEDWTFLGITLGIAILIWLLDYIIPALGTKKYGGSKYGIYGTTIGLICGLIFLGPIGIIIGPFAGAFLGEMIYDSKDSNRALKAAFGSFVGFLFSTGLKFLVSIIYTGMYISIAWEYKSSFF
tara:strand:- start:19885 stop:20385 length:501 start_codon:yes stop_codon:yes gene_type:complete